MKWHQVHFNSLIYVHFLGFWFPPSSWSFHFKSVQFFYGPSHRSSSHLRPNTSVSLSSSSPSSSQVSSLLSPFLGSPLGTSLRRRTAQNKRPREGGESPYAAAAAVTASNSSSRCSCRRQTSRNSFPLLRCECLSVCTECQHSSSVLFLISTLFGQPSAVYYISIYRKNLIRQRSLFKIGFRDYKRVAARQILPVTSRMERERDVFRHPGTLHRTCQSGRLCHSREQDRMRTTPFPKGWARLHWLRSDRFCLFFLFLSFLLSFCVSVSLFLLSSSSTMFPESGEEVRSPLGAAFCLAFAASPTILTVVCTDGATRWFDGFLRPFPPPRTFNWWWWSPWP